MVLEGSKAPYVTVSQEYFQNFQRLVVLRAGERVLFVTECSQLWHGNFGQINSCSLESLLLCVVGFGCNHNEDLV